MPPRIKNLEKSKEVLSFQVINQLREMREKFKRPKNCDTFTTGQHWVDFKDKRKGGGIIRVTITALSKPVGKRFLSVADTKECELDIHYLDCSTNESTITKASILMLDDELYVREFFNNNAFGQRDETRLANVVEILTAIQSNEAKPYPTAI
ncbi:hypothetical protein IT417_02265 [bacterium]|nr:hypothetical protein [bacterium]